jgi:hypothetical protein
MYNIEKTGSSGYSVFHISDLEMRAQWYGSEGKSCSGNVNHAFATLCVFNVTLVGGQLCRKGDVIGGGRYAALRSQLEYLGNRLVESPPPWRRHDSSRPPYGTISEKTWHCRMNLGSFASLGKK